MKIIGFIASSRKEGNTAWAVNKILEKQRLEKDAGWRRINPNLPLASACGTNYRRRPPMIFVKGKITFFPFDRPCSF
jgi:hypothetical protein